MILKNKLRKVACMAQRGDCHLSSALCLQANTSEVNQKVNCVSATCNVARKSETRRKGCSVALASVPGTL